MFAFLIAFSTLCVRRHLCKRGNVSLDLIAAGIRVIVLSSGAAEGLADAFGVIVPGSRICPNRAIRYTQATEATRQKSAALPPAATCLAPAALRLPALSSLSFQGTNKSAKFRARGRCHLRFREKDYTARGVHKKGGSGNLLFHPMKLRGRFQVVSPEPVEEDLSAVLEGKFILGTLVSTVAIAAARHTVERCLIRAF